MADWIDRLEETSIERKADESMAAQKYQLLLSAVARLRPIVTERVRSDVEKFKGLYPRRIDGPEETAEGGLKVRTERFPLNIIEFTFDSQQILFKKRRKQAPAAEFVEENGAILVKTDFNTKPWFEFKGGKMLTPEEVSQFLLADVCSLP